MKKNQSVLFRLVFCYKKLICKFLESVDFDIFDTIYGIRDLGNLVSGYRQVKEADYTMKSGTVFYSDVSKK